MNSAIEQQRRYYAETADRYDEMHHWSNDEHAFALAWLAGLLPFLKATSVLDVGAGTGRAQLYLARQEPDVQIVGVEPVAALRAMGHAAGISEGNLIAGDATALPFDTESFDVVSAFGVLHHVPHPERAVAEMLRVARVGIFISDSNNFGQGSFVVRSLKQALNAAGLWRAADWIKTGGKGYTESADDGIAYSYSIYQNWRQIAGACRRVHILSTEQGRVPDANPYRSSGHVALLGLKRLQSDAARAALT